jgi:hypothetical protein
MNRNSELATASRGSEPASHRTDPDAVRGKTLRNGADFNHDNISTRTGKYVCPKHEDISKIHMEPIQPFYLSIPTFVPANIPPDLEGSRLHTGLRVQLTQIYPKDVSFVQADLITDAP